MRITVFTPAYNRAYIIEELYHSLQRQSFKDFEWLVIDDGSADGTTQLFDRILKEDNFFPVRYFRSENGGKHRAINRGVKLAEGELFFIVDSDDYLTDNALELADRIEKSIPDDEKRSFAGVCGLRGKSADLMHGSTFTGSILDITSLEREKHGITGDKAEVFYTELLRQYPFPEFPGEKFITECVVWDRIAADGFKLRFFNEIIYIGDYLSDGLSANVNDLFRNNPKGTELYMTQSTRLGKLTGQVKWDYCLEYFYKYRDKKPFADISGDLGICSFYLFIRLLAKRIINKLAFLGVRQ